jgi:hypothetical protein
MKVSGFGKRGLRAAVLKVQIISLQRGVCCERHFRGAFHRRTEGWNPVRSIEHCIAGLQLLARRPGPGVRRDARHGDTSMRSDPWSPLHLGKPRKAPFDFVRDSLLEETVRCQLLSCNQNLFYAF